MIADWQCWNACQKQFVTFFARSGLTGASCIPGPVWTVPHFCPRATVGDAAVEPELAWVLSGCDAQATSPTLNRAISRASVSIINDGLRFCINSFSYLFFS